MCHIQTVGPCCPPDKALLPLLCHIPEIHGRGCTGLRERGGQESREEGATFFTASALLTHSGEGEEADESKIIIGHHPVVSTVASSWDSPPSPPFIPPHRITVSYHVTRQDGAAVRVCLHRPR